MTRGAALPATLFALAMTSAMAVGGLYVARRHLAVALENSAAVTLRPEAERAAIDAVLSWDSLARAGQPIGATIAISAAPAPAVWITRTAEAEYLVVSEARSLSSPSLYHRIALSVVIGGGKPRLPFPRAWAALP